MPTCLQSSCGPQEGCTTSTGRAGLRVPAEPLNSLKYNQPLSLPASCWGRAETLPSPPNLGTRPGPRRRVWAVGAPTGCWERKLGSERGRLGQGPPSQQPPLQLLPPPPPPTHPGQPEAAEEQRRPHRGKPGPWGSTQGPGATGEWVAPAQGHCEGFGPHFPFPVPKSPPQERSRKALGRAGGWGCSARGAAGPLYHRTTACASLIISEKLTF